MERSSAVLVSLGVLIGLTIGLALGYAAFSPRKPSSYAECLLMYGEQNGMTPGVQRACSSLFPGPGLPDQPNQPIRAN